MIRNSKTNEGLTEENFKVIYYVQFPTDQKYSKKGSKNI